MESEVKPAVNLVEWSDDLVIGVASADQAHRQLFSLVHALKLETLERHRIDLESALARHFSSEQAMMERSSYPASEQHTRLHDEFRAQVKAYLDADGVWDESRVQELRRFLNHWLVGHIMAHDLRFGKWYVRQQAHAAQRLSTARMHQPAGIFARWLGRQPSPAHR